MKGYRLFRTARWLIPGMVLLQATGCNYFAAFELLQTIFLGITAAGAIAILENI